MDKFRKSLLLSIKIGIGCSAAVYLAQHLQLDYAASAGTITLLTVMTSKWESLRLAGLRIVTFLQTVVLAWAVFTFIPNPWVAYGILLATVVFIAEISGWRATTSVNAVIAAHLLSDKNLDHAVWNEFGLVMIGIVIAILMNLYHANAINRKSLITHMRRAEKRLQEILEILADYLANCPQEEVCGMRFVHWNRNYRSMCMRRMNIRTIPFLRIRYITFLILKCVMISARYCIICIMR